MVAVDYDLDPKALKGFILQPKVANISCTLVSEPTINPALPR